MDRTRAALPLLAGWLPIAALFTTLIVAAHGGPIGPAVRVALRMVLAAALLGVVVHRATLRWPWPHPFRLGFVARHVFGAAAYAAGWLLLNIAIESALRAQLVMVGGPGIGIVPYLVLGVWLYVMIAGVSYASRATARAAELEALAARTQLEALRAQLHPHFLFNALHTVVQLIPLDPRAAAHAAEQLGETLRIAVDERRERVPLRDELAFVERYLALEALRFGARLATTRRIDEAALDAMVPAFALQTLVENAVRHGAAPSVEPVDLVISARRAGDLLELTVEDSGIGLAPSGSPRDGGLARLRRRLAASHGSAARLDVVARAPRGARATLVLPWEASR